LFPFIIVSPAGSVAADFAVVEADSAEAGFMEGVDSAEVALVAVDSAAAPAVASAEAE
jgi:hypothetical protein